MTDVSSQVAAAHLELIEAVGAALADDSPDTTTRTAALCLVDRYRQDGWHALADALGARLADSRDGDDERPDDSSLDEEDRMILAASVRAAQDPGWLSRVAEQAEAQAAEQIAALILAATWGEREALAALNEMREAARAAGMDGSTAHGFVAMVEGERDADALLAAHVNAQASLIRRTLAALDRLEREAD